ncbi:inactive protein kinase SELMODRAFT_444075 isoform X2 [Daucus carota subsp. sativus]|nr:PREDICTED: inactive protein kinase SELMODRAFT_444075-like isoform X2 [Daucus carota subsp. sativus]XP_017238694.1 PREDICTED: inactive protein kinase SELMODRAFT_444075-like isoform X2 [Daucus carota subsp. sativus]
MEKTSEERGLDGMERVVLVAVKASREISRNSLVWALTHIVHPGDCVKLLVVVPVQTSSRKLWSFGRFGTDCAGSPWKSLSGTMDQKDDISVLCTEMMLQLRNIYDINKINIKVKVISGSSGGVVAAEAKIAPTHWVVLDKQLKKEAKYCKEQLACNLVVMKRSRAKVLRLNLVELSKVESNELSGSDSCTEHLNNKCSIWTTTRVPNVTPSSSPDHSSFSVTDTGTSSLSSLDRSSPPFVIADMNWDRKKDSFSYSEGQDSLEELDSDIESEKLSSPSTSVYFQPWTQDALSSSGEVLKCLAENSQISGDKAVGSMSAALQEKFSGLDKYHKVNVLSDRHNQYCSSNLRETISFRKNALAEPPPLCSICQHKAPVFGKPPKWFTYAELQYATDGFSEANFLAEGGFGSVYRGVLSEGQVVAVKQHKIASSQGDQEFCAEVEVLSCAQHRNVVLLIGFCVDDDRRLLVYEYICNGSLDHHLYGRNQDAIKWSARQRIAVGAARGLRYLHEECRVGCIVHRDMRPNNILLTHDFEPLVGDFGLAKWQPERDTGVETRVIGTFGYLAPEYAQTGEVTEKADVYSFGVVLVELITGRKAIDLNRPKGQQSLTEWARPLLAEKAVSELIDPRIRNCYAEQELLSMLHCASLCIRQDPHSRPCMSQVLQILERDNFMK